MHVIKSVTMAQWTHEYQVIIVEQYFKTGNSMIPMQCLFCIYVVQCEMPWKHSITHSAQCQALSLWMSHWSVYHILTQRLSFSPIQVIDNATFAQRRFCTMKRILWNNTDTVIMMDDEARFNLDSAKLASVGS